MQLPYIVKLIFNKYLFYKIFALSLLMILFFIFQNFIFLFLITFLLAYLFLYLWEVINAFLYKYINKIKFEKLNIFLKKMFWINLVVLYLYILFVWFIVFSVSTLLPKITQELSDLPKYLPFLSGHVDTVLYRLEELKNFNQDFQWTLKTIFTESNINIIMKFLWNIKSVWLLIIEFLISLILSYFFIIDRFKIKIYLEEVKKWNFAFLYKEYSIIFEKISRWFGIILKAQSLIAIANTVLTTIWLYLIGFINIGQQFPYMFTLVILVFILSFIPVLWVFLSSIAIIAIWFTFWWLPVVIELIILIMIIHSIEAYYLNPKIVSSYAQTPISLTFLILIISEQIFWVIWLLIWVPIFYIILDFLKDFDEYVWNIKWAYFKINELKDCTKTSLSSKIRLSRAWKRL